MSDYTRVRARIFNLELQVLELEVALAERDREISRLQREIFRAPRSGRSSTTIMRIRRGSTS